MNTSMSKHALLKEWPHVRTDQPTSPFKKNVSFATYSQCKMYPVDQQFESKKSYSSEDSKAFQLQSLQDVSQIKALIEACPYEGGNAICYLVNNQMLQREELLGIESTIVCPQQTAKERRKHSAFVLKAQEDVKRMNDADLEQKLLAHAARTRSLGTARKACYELPSLNRSRHGVGILLS